MIADNITINKIAECASKIFKTCRNETQEEISLYFIIFLTKSKHEKTKKSHCVPHNCRLVVVCIVARLKPRHGDVFDHPITVRHSSDFWSIETVWMINGSASFIAIKAHRAVHLRVVHSIGAIDRQFHEIRSDSMELCVWIGKHTCWKERIEIPSFWFG